MKLVAIVLVFVAGGHVACAGSVNPSAKAEAELEEEIIPPDFLELALIELTWTSPSIDYGYLEGILPTGEAASAQVVLRNEGQLPRGTDTGNVDPGMEEGADVFGPFPEQWPDRTNTVLGPGRSTSARARLVSDAGQELECRFLLNDADRGFFGGARGVCTAADGTRYRSIVR